MKKAKQSATTIANAMPKSAKQAHRETSGRIVQEPAKPPRVGKAAIKAAVARVAAA